MIIPLPQLSEIHINSLFKAQSIRMGFAKLLSSQEKNIQIVLFPGFGVFVRGQNNTFF